MKNSKSESTVLDASAKKELIHRSRKLGWFVFTALLVVVIIALMLLPRMINRDQEETDSNILSAEVTEADIDTTIMAAGTLLDTEATYITVPKGVELEYAVKNGDLLAPGDLIATVDETSVMLTIAELQSAMDTIDARIEEARNGETATSITAPADARVKAVYATSGNSVSEVMYNNGALLVLSLDGHMAVDIAAAFARAGEGVFVTLSDGTIVDGRVSSIAGSMASVTISDNGPIAGDQVLVHNEDGVLLGEGELYIHSELKVTGYYGTVDQVNVSVDESITSGTELLTITAADTSAGYAGLLAQRHEMEEQMDNLFKIYQRGGIYAEESGYAAEIETDSSRLLSVSLTGNEAGVVFLSDIQETQGISDPAEMPEPTVLPTNTPSPTAEPTPTPVPDNTPEPSAVPTEEPITTPQPTEKPEEMPVPTEEPTETPSPTEEPEETPVPTEEPTETPAPTEKPEESPKPSETPEPVVGVYEDVYACVAAVAEGELTLRTAETDAYIHYGDYEALKALEYSVESTIMPEEDITVFLYDDGAWSIVNTAQIQNGDYLVLTYFSSEQSEQLMWIICNRGDDSQNSDESDSDDPTSSTTPSPSTSPDSDSSGEMSSGSSSSSTRSNSSGSWSNSSQSVTGAPAGMMSQVQSYTLSEIQVCAITPDTNMTVEIQIDELDILSVYEGQEVVLILDALNGQRFAGTVTDIANEATNNGGSAKFAVEITLQRELDMRTGMNAAVTILVSEHSVGCAIPVEALVEDGADTFVYTGYDEKKNELKDPVYVTTGVSDGALVEIISGLEAGMTVYYEYLGTLSEIIV